VSGSETHDFHPDIGRALDYIRSHPEVRDVLVSGGDPLLLADERIAWLLNRLREIEHVEFLRIGTRIPVVMPQRITPELCGILREAAPLFVSIHMNHPREATREVGEAMGRLVDAGIPVGNQSVLLRGVNDDPAVMKDLVHRLLAMRVRPYYLYQCDLVEGTSHLRAPVARGLEVMDALRGHTTGYAVPQYVIDSPGGGGKVPIGPGYILHRDEERVVIRNYDGKVFEYPEPACADDAAACPADCCPASCCR
jgi:lysine 2,3-aminomutase